MKLFLSIFILLFSISCSNSDDKVISNSQNEVDTSLDSNKIADSLNSDSLNIDSLLNDSTIDSINSNSDSIAKDSINMIKGLYVKDRFLYAPDGEKIILRGVNLMSVWNDRKGEKLKEIAKTGANVVRIVWTIKDYRNSAEIDTVLRKCLENNMIPMLENHSATGDWNSLGDVIDWWLQDDMVALLKKYEKYILVNIANEAGNSVSKTNFYNGYADAIKRFREKNLNMPLIIDGSKYGQNIYILESEGPKLLEADPISNVMFSVHMWWPLKYYSDVESKVVEDIAKCVELNLPLIVGEFGEAFSDAGEPTAQDSIPYKLIIKECNENEIGWLAWSWGPGNNPQTDLDMTTDGTFESLHDWGLEVAVQNQYSIKNTAIRPKFITEFNSDNQ